jgi:hypothetical protein
MKLQHKILVLLAVLVTLVLVTSPSETKAQTQFCKTCFWNEGDCYPVADGVPCSQSARTKANVPWSLWILAVKPTCSLNPWDLQYPRCL